MKILKYVFPAMILTGFVFLLRSTSAINGSPDAIAVRIVPNKEHYSALRWYQEQDFSGSPQTLLVDGYEAVRDGRTVYVNVANVSDLNNNNILDKNDKFYTNIFIISYNQDAENATVDIFGQILANWKFNINMNTAGSCKTASSTSCVYPQECPSSDYCTSSKGVSVRDTKRLADLADLDKNLSGYKSQHGGLCPKISSGSYLPNKTISVWPSWQATLGQEIGMTLPIDPINRLGKCKSDNNENKKYDPKTCWNETDKIFAGTTVPNFSLPDDSRSYIYISSSDGQSCSFYVTTESGLVCDNNGACTVSNDLTDPFITSIPAALPAVKNQAPAISCGKLTGMPNNSFVGYVSASDPENDSLNWSILTSPADGVTTDWSAWAEKPQLRPSAIASQKEVFSGKVNSKGSYPFKVKVTDSKGSSTVKDCTIFINNTCGNGVIENGVDNPPMYSSLNYGETCDSGITDIVQRCNGLKNIGIKDSDSNDLDCSNVNNNMIGSNGINTLYTSICDSATCKFGGTGGMNPTLLKYLGMGCYIGQTFNTSTGQPDPAPATSCQKGAWVLENGLLVCKDIFAGAMKDYCCSSQGNALKTGSVDFEIVRAEPQDLTEGVIAKSWYYFNAVSYYGTAYVDPFMNYYTCDGVCKRVGKVCVGVGLSNYTKDACISVRHDTGCEKIGNTCYESGSSSYCDQDPTTGDCLNCSNASNALMDNCKSVFSLAGASSGVQIGGYLGTCVASTYPWDTNKSNYQNFHVGETACYCK